jgi:NitT/TauT family transport system permease protein
MPTTDGVNESDLNDQELAGLDKLESAPSIGRNTAASVWSNLWPKIGALVIGLFLWQVVVWSEWKPEYILPGPGKTFSTLWEMLREGTIWEATLTTMRRAFVGYFAAVLIGLVIGGLVARIRAVRAAFGSFITGIQTMPSIAWFPLAIVLFQLSERAILFVVVSGAAPAIANGLISGADNIPPVLLRAGKVLGARGWNSFRHIVFPASLPGLVSGLKQGWAFAWRSLMAGELLVIIKGKPSIGSLLQENRAVNDYRGLLAVMIVILVIGIIVDSVVFGRLGKAIMPWMLLIGGRTSRASEVT